MRPIFASRSAPQNGAAEHQHSPFGDAHSGQPTPEVEIFDLHAALEKMAALDPLETRALELRYFTGLSIPETAEVTGAFKSTVKREWMVARTWIRRKLLEGAPER